MSLEDDKCPLLDGPCPVNFRISIRDAKKCQEKCVKLLRRGERCRVDPIVLRDPRPLSEKIADSIERNRARRSGH